jgi:hypothetical protein
MEMYKQHFSLNIFNIFKYVKNIFQIKEAYTTGIQKAMSAAPPSLVVGECLTRRPKPDTHLHNPRRHPLVSSLPSRQNRVAALRSAPLPQGIHSHPRPPTISSRVARPLSPKLSRSTSLRPAASATRFTHRQRCARRPCLAAIFGTDKSKPLVSFQPRTATVFCRVRQVMAPELVSAAAPRPI